ncbi:MAG: DNA repair protein RecO [Desulfovermiculus sp.]|nr:DNA repair protein RecO [Desulfovermiculus sp.]
MTRQESRGEHALVLRVGTFREIDCWVRFFSPLRGVETAFAFGGRRSRRRFSGCLDTLNHLRVDVQTPRSGRYLAWSQGTLVHRFAGLHRDLSRMGMAVNCVKFLESAHIGAQQAEPVFDLVLQALQVLSGTTEVPASFPLLFRAKLTCLYGYGPEVTTCGLCGQVLSGERGESFSWAEGVAVCAKCRRQFEQSAVMSELDLGRMQTLLQGGPMDWVRFGCSQPGDKRLWQVLDFFVAYHTGLQWNGGWFRRL